jgi:hypothetical protein
MIMRKLLAVMGVLGVLVGGGAGVAQEKNAARETCTLTVRGMT